MNQETTTVTAVKSTLSNNDLQSIIESLLFTLARPVLLQELLEVFQKEQISSAEITQALNNLNKKYQEHTSCGIELKEVANGYQLRTKEENKDYIRRCVKGRLFKLSAPALEVLVIVAYQQPCKKSTIDKVRGIESGHLLKTLIEKNLVGLGRRSADPGRPMTYNTTEQFLETFGIKSLKELPSSEDIQDLLSSENESDNPQKGVDTILREIEPSINNSASVISKGREVIAHELEFVGEEINSVKLSKQHNKVFLKDNLPNPDNKK